MLTGGLQAFQRSGWLAGRRPPRAVFSTPVRRGERPAVSLVRSSHAPSSSCVTYRIEGGDCRARPFPRLVSQRKSDARCASEQGDARSPHGVRASRHVVRPRPAKRVLLSVVALRLSGRLLGDEAWEAAVPGQTTL